MTLTLSLAILLLSDINHYPRYHEVRIDYLELNHVVRSKDVVIDQLLFMRWDRDAFVVDDYLRAPGWFELPRSPMIRFMDGTLWKVHFRFGQETTSDYDPERDNLFIRSRANRRPIFAPLRTWRYVDVP